MKRTLLISCGISLGSLWWFWPLLAPTWAQWLGWRAPRGAVVVLAEDPRRTKVALDLWLQHPEKEFWILGWPTHQKRFQDQWQERGFNPAHPQLRTLLEGEDTVGQFTALSHYLSSDVGQLIVVTDQAHRDRSQVIASWVMGARGVEVQSPHPGLLPKTTSKESVWRRYRDLLRVQLWRAVGWDGREIGLLMKKIHRRLT